MATNLLLISLVVFVTYTYAARPTYPCDDLDTCSDPNSYCFKDTFCQKGSCQCKPGYDYYANTGDCIPEAIPGDSCIDTDHCTFGSCFGDTCQCSGGLILSPDKTRCIGKDLGESCIHKYQCTASYLNHGDVSCTGICKCSTGYKPTEDNKSCTPYGAGEECTEDTHCVLQASCINGRCTCNNVNGFQYTQRRVYDRNIYVYPRDIMIDVCLPPSSREVSHGDACNLDERQGDMFYCPYAHICLQCPEDYDKIDPNTNKCLRYLLPSNITEGSSSTTPRPATPGDTSGSTHLLLLPINWLFLALIDVTFALRFCLLN